MEEVYPINDGYTIEPYDPYRNYGELDKDQRYWYPSLFGFIFTYLYTKIK